MGWGGGDQVMATITNMFSGLNTKFHDFTCFPPSFLSLFFCIVKQNLTATTKPALHFLLLVASWKSSLWKYLSKHGVKLILFPKFFICSPTEADSHMFTFPATNLCLCRDFNVNMVDSCSITLWPLTETNMAAAAKLMLRLLQPVGGCRKLDAASDSEKWSLAVL